MNSNVVLTNKYHIEASQEKINTLKFKLQVVKNEIEDQQRQFEYKKRVELSKKEQENNKTLKHFQSMINQERENEELNDKICNQEKEKLAESHNQQIQQLENLHEDQLLDLYKEHENLMEEQERQENHFRAEELRLWCKHSEIYYEQ